MIAAEAADDIASRSSISDRLLDAAGRSVERLPMLHVVFDRLATQCSDNFRLMSTTVGFFQVQEVGAARIGNILDSYMNNVIAAVFFVPEWDSRILIGLDRRFVFTAVELLFGGDGTETPLGDARPFSNIEQRVAQSILEQTAESLHTCFASVIDVTFKFERVETRMDFGVIGRRSNLAVLAKINMHALDRGGEIFIMIPQAALNPFRENLSRDLSSELAAHDARWTKQIETEVIRADVSLRAILEETGLTLGDISDLRVGKLLMLQATPDTPIKIECRDQPLFWGKLGQANGAYTICVEGPIDQEREFLDAILPR